MNLEVNKTEFLRALEVAARAVNPRSPQPIYSALMLEVTDGLDTPHLRITGTDGEIVLTAICQLKIGELAPGKLAVTAEGFLSVVKGLPGPSISLATTKTQLVVKSGRSRYNLPVLVDEAWPVVPKVEEHALFVVDEAALSASLGRVLPAVGTDGSRPVMCGVYWKLEGQRLTLVATDTHRMHVATTRAMASTGETAFILGANAAKELAKLLDNGDCTLTTDGQGVSVIGSWGTFLARLIGGNYVDYERFIPKRSEFAEFGQGELADAIKRAAYVAQGSADRLVVTLGDGTGAKMEAASEAFGEFEEELSVLSGDAPEQQFAVSSRNLGAAVAAAPNASVRLYRSATQKAIMIGGEDTEEFFAVIIPMRLPSDA